ncbi:hypothetical protein IFM89_008823 [Coptis chinensis]|uniref:Uncharacterized protein n=1 Tax=Coptis chinensis TaxID=261450 RepID=A0A835HDJ4_9MAGN|nr:hypothetical protein IFM89_008823 [Coptis chinensis]
MNGRTSSGQKRFASGSSGERTYDRNKQQVSDSGSTSKRTENGRQITQSDDSTSSQRVGSLSLRDYRNEHSVSGFQSSGSVGEGKQQSSSFFNFERLSFQVLADSEEELEDDISEEETSEYFNEHIEKDAPGAPKNREALEEKLYTRGRLPFLDCLNNYGLSDLKSADHSSILLHLIDTEKRHLPFRLCNLWALHDDYEQEVKQVWDTQLYGTPMYILCQKLKILKSKLKLWAIKYLSELSHRIEAARGELKDIYKYNYNPII